MKKKLGSQIIRYDKAVIVAFSVFLAFPAVAVDKNNTSTNITTIIQKSKCLSLNRVWKNNTCVTLSKNTPQAKGIILTFKHWPLNKAEQKIILQKTKELSLTIKEKSDIFENWILEWDGWRKGDEALKACGLFKNIKFIKYCSPDFLLEPAGVFRKIKFKKLHQKYVGQTGSTSKKTVISVSNTENLDSLEINTSLVV